MIIGKPFLSTDQIQQKVKDLAEQISRDYAGQEFVAIGILKGAFMFFSDIVRFIQVPIEIDFITASSYAKTESSGKITIHSDIRKDITDLHVLLIEDIVDTGITLKYIREKMLARNPASLKICTLLNKKAKRTVDVPLDYVGFDIPDKYVVGYGLDYDNKFRNLPYISIFKKST